MLNDSNRKRPCDLLSRPKQVNNHLFREQKVKGRQGCEILGWKNRPYIMKESGQRTLRRHTRREGVSLSDTKSDVLYHMETIARSCVKASVSVHGNWIVLTLQGFNALMLWGSLVGWLFLCWWEHPATRKQLPTLHTWSGSSSSNQDPAFGLRSLDPPASRLCVGNFGFPPASRKFLPSPRVLEIKPKTKQKSYTLQWFPHF